MLDSAQPGHIADVAAFFINQIIVEITVILKFIIIIIIFNTIRADLWLSSHIQNVMCPKRPFLTTSYAETGQVRKHKQFAPAIFFL